MGPQLSNGDYGGCVLDVAALPHPVRHFGGMPRFLIAPSKGDTPNCYPDALLVRRL